MFSNLYQVTEVKDWRLFTKDSHMDICTVGHGGIVQRKKKDVQRKSVQPLKGSCFKLSKVTTIIHRLSYLERFMAEFINCDSHLLELNDTRWRPSDIYSCVGGRKIHKNKSTNAQTTMNICVANTNVCNVRRSNPRAPAQQP